MQGYKEYKINKIFILVFVLIILSIISKALSFIELSENYDKEINEKLEAAAEIADGRLTKEFHDRALSRDSISKEEDLQNTLNLSEYANKKEFITYIYSMIIVEEEGEKKVYITSSSATESEIKEGNLYAYFEHYEEATDELLNIFKTNKAVYEVTKDSYGHFRSILMPMKTKKGNLYVVGADLKQDYIDEYLEHELIHDLLEISIQLLVAVLFLIKIYQDYKIINNQSKIDRLTKVYNRGYFYEILKSFMNTYNKQEPMSLLIIDIDHFKHINDSFGHIMGDKVLEMVSNLMLTNLRKEDVIARYGGEEFLILLPMSDIISAKKVAEKMRKKVEELEITYEDAHINITVSIGVCLYKGEKDIDAFIHKADVALYDAKNSGRNCIRISEEGL